MPAEPDAILVRAHQVPAFEREGWQVCYPRPGGPREADGRPDRRDCVMVRVREQWASDPDQQVVRADG